MRVLVLSTICLIAVTSVATVLPESADLHPADKQLRPIQDGLEAWLEAHADKQPFTELQKKSFEAWLKKQDKLSQVFAELRVANKASKPNPAALESAASLVRDETQLKAANEHPVLPYLLREFLASKGAKPDDLTLAARQLVMNGGRSCPSKEVMLKGLSSTSGADLSVEQFEQLLAEIDRFKSKKFRKEALESFLDTLPQKFQSEFKSKLAGMVGSFPTILEDNLWLMGPKIEGALEASEPYISLREAESEAGKKHCRTAKITLIKAMGKDEDKTAYDTVVRVAEKIEGCFRPKGSAAREKFWVQIENSLTKTYGFRGKELARRNVGLLAWSRDDFTRARTLFLSLIDEAEKNNETSLLGESLYTLARIEENDSKIGKSLEYYQRFVNTFPSSVRYLEALQAMALLFALEGRLSESLSSAQAIVEAQSKLSIDEQDTGVLSYALFWAGRLNFTLGNKELAQEYWRRVASEYYSTFYGALGHFVLEKLEGKHLELEPNRRRPFNLDNFTKFFDESDTKVLASVETLLKLGLRDDASCELSEIAIDDNGKEKILVKSLYQHAAGEWLTSIINYSGLPRSFRHSLPVGFERLLFPRAYVSEVSSYAEKLELDPDLVFAIIRQESVFNPMAMSGAGARGLMQLMPATAKLESRQLAKAYLPSAERSRLRESALTRNNLFDADTNLALGIHHVHRLLARYGNPIYVLTAYNANPRATERWRRNIPTEDILTFIERIPYRETQAYVKLVLRNYFYYKRWYRPASSQLPHLDYMAKNVMKIAAAENK